MAQEVHSEPRALKVLIVDDDAIIREVMRAQLSVLGVPAMDAANRTEAIERLRADVFDLVFLDSRLPDLTEDDVLAAIPDIGSRTIVAVMSGLERLPPPGTKFVLKPLSLADLRVIVEDATQRVAVASTARSHDVDSR